MVLRVQISKKKGCITELEYPISGGLWKIKTRGTFRSRNIHFQNLMTQLQNGVWKIKSGGAFSSRNISVQNLMTQLQKGV